MPMWAIILTVVFSGVVMLISVAGFLRSFQFATKEDIARLEKRIDIISERIDRHLEGHP